MFQKLIPMTLMLFAGLPQPAGAQDRTPWNSKTMPNKAMSKAGMMPADGMMMSSHTMMHDDFFHLQRRRRSVKHYSWIYIDPPEPHEIQLHDIITIIVDEKSEVTSNSRFNRSRTATLKAELKEFIRIGNRGNLNTAAPNQPTIDANLNDRFSGTGQQTDQEGTRFRVAATVVDIRPNGNIVVEARKTIRTNRDIWSYSLTGTFPSTAIQRNNTVLSENIANLNIVKNKNGKVNDSVRIPWGSRFFNIFFPF